MKSGIRRLLILIVISCCLLTVKANAGQTTHRGLKEFKLSSDQLALLEKDREFTCDFYEKTVNLSNWLYTLLLRKARWDAQASTLRIAPNPLKDGLKKAILSNTSFLEQKCTRPVVVNRIGARVVTIQITEFLALMNAYQRGQNRDESNTEVKSNEAEEHESKKKKSKEKKKGGSGKQLADLCKVLKSKEQTKVDYLSIVEVMIRQSAEVRDKEDDLKMFMTFIEEIRTTEPVLCAAMAKFLQLYAEDQDVQVKAVYERVICALRIFVKKKKTIDYAMRSGSLKQKSAACGLMAEQMNTIAWLSKLLKKAKMHDQVNYTYGENLEKQTAFLNEGAKAMLRYSLVVHHKTTKDINAQLAILAQKASSKPDSSSVTQIIEKVKKRLNVVNTKIKSGKAALGRADLITGFRGYYKSVAIQKALASTYTALNELELELENDKKPSTSDSKDQVPNVIAADDGQKSEATS